MKRALISVFAAILCIIPAVAETVSVSKASAAASAFFNGRSGTRSGLRPTLVWTGTSSGTRSASDPAFYVFNFNGGGFVVIAGDDAAQPVLGYSETGSFRADNLPSNIRDWFDGYASQVEFIRKNRLTATADIVQAWNAVMGGLLKDSGNKKELKTPTWGQDEPYYGNCPEVDGHKAVTGCVATAVAEIMRYHRWPERATGKLPGYKYKSDLGNEITIPEHTFSGTYNWNEMPEAYFVRKSGQWYKNYTEDQARAVAAVMEDAGKMLQSYYNSADSELGTEGTGATSYDIPLVLVRYMAYDSTAILKHRDDMKYDQWAAMLKTEIDEGRPVCYSGSGDSGGHQFILDGYSDNMFYINWGWDSQNNGWFSLQALNPTGYSFSFSQTAVVGIRPARNSLSPAAMEIFYYSDEGLRVTSGNLGKSNSKVEIETGTIVNCNFGSGLEDIKGETLSLGTAVIKPSLCLVDKDDNVKTILDSLDEFLSLKPGFGYTVSFDFNTSKIQKTVLGDKIVCCYCTKDDSRMIPIRTKGDYVNSTPDAIAIYDFPMIDVNPDGYKAGDVLDLRIINICRTPEVKWYFDGTELDDRQTYVALTTGTHTVKAVLKLIKDDKGGSVERTETLVRKIIVK